MVSTRTQRYLFQIMGALYVVGGAAALVNATFAWHSGTTGSPLFYLAFGAMYFALSYLFFTRQRSLIPVVGLILLSNLALWGYRSWAIHALAWMGLVAIVINALVLWYLLSVRADLADAQQGRSVAIVAVATGAIAYYMVISSYLL
jgi:hypothetical protein